MISRRTLLAGTAALAGTALFGRPGSAPAFTRPLPPAAVPGPETIVSVELKAAERALSLPCFDGHALPMWTFADQATPPVIRLALGQRLNTHLVNGLTRPGEHVSIHWHGIRLPNDQDGVPYLVQKPVEPGESYDYSFVPPDTGTFFFHTHCNTVEQLGRGLAGILIIDGDAPEPYDADELLVLKDWRLNDDNTGFLPFLTPEGAGKSGTFGTVRSVNGMVEPDITVPASGDVRLRIVNIDPTRVSEIGVEGAEAAVVAIDGLACQPFPLRSWRMGPAMRADLVIRTPADGGTATLFDYFSAKPVPLARFMTKGPARRTTPFDPAPLASARITAPDLSAPVTPMTFSATATAQSVASAAGDDQGFLGPLCLAAGTFWAINKASWPGGGMDQIPPPLLKLERGRSYRLQLRNVTPRMHPIHIHGHSFTVLKSNKRELPPHFADTVLLLPEERVDVAFVADNPGRWMLHCHIIEHQETGMMGWVEVA
ncbi:multicopper oxidase family protein [Kaistia dalseonensis]|uniref:FtsP/CotA-like multicopper oxidase with cupredoxin domain n=1 Tax=Kaistia dalseonensis TaxID=410840 RepID=A0ABU0H6C0_9HYPH|nr:multicopper oxidase family protein [Kaistia dalseonensis]MCX5495250.1 multicopper oxidase family protein [Kaistia dalseonensis]MDQ0437836.1 FtsP/CotA-like multicopper oxidase with cupredoxin domain [Kaistia dalseonensis]